MKLRKHRMHKFKGQCQRSSRFKNMKIFLLTVFLSVISAMLPEYLGAEFGDPDPNQDPVPNPDPILELPDSLGSECGGVDDPEPGKCNPIGDFKPFESSLQRMLANAEVSDKSSQ